MTITTLKPKETAIFENEQKSRFSPDGVASGVAGDGASGTITFSPDGTALIDGGITLHNLAGGSGFVLRLLDDVAVIDDGTYTLENDGVVNPVSQLAVLLIDINDSITNYVVTINGTDAADAGISDVLTFTSGGEVQFTANGPYKTVTSITGGPVSGTFSGDLLRVLPRLGTLAHDHLGRMSNSWLGDNDLETDRNLGPNNTKGAYAEAVDTGDKEVRVSFPALPAEVVSITSVKVAFESKNLAATSNGIEYILRHTGGNHVLETNTSVSLDTGIAHVSSIAAMTDAPGTGASWTLAQFNSIELGFILKGDSPTVTKQAMRVRIEIVCKTEPTGTTEPVVVDAFLEALSGDPFDEGSGDDGKYVEDFDTQDTRLDLSYPALPDEAIGVLNVKAFWRAAAIHGGHPNSGTTNTKHCAIGGASGGSVEDSVQPRGGSGRHYGQGPIEQSNLGGWQPGMNSAGGSLETFGDEDNGRILNGPGNPDDGCGFASGYMGGRNLPWETPVNHSEVLSVTPGIGNPWSVTNWNGFLTSFEVGGREDEFRWFKTYAEPEWLRSPTGDTYFHLVVRDDLGSENDDEYMSSQHPDNKQFGCTFAGIDEATAINSISGRVRGWTSVGAAKGWKIKLKVGATTFTQTGDPEHMNTTPADVTAIWTQHPTESRPWTRDEVNSAILIWEAQGENAYYEKFVSNMALLVDFLGIPDKIDTARRLGSEILLFQGRPVPMLELRVPFSLGNAKLIEDVSVSHDAVLSVVKTLGLEKWERSLFRLMEKVLDPNTDTWKMRLYHLTDFLVTFVMSGQAVTKGRGFDGMSLITPGANMQFVRGTNDYQEDPFADLIQELQANEPPTNTDGILIQNPGVNRMINSAFSEGAVDVFDGWTKVGDGAAGAQIVESNADSDPIVVGGVPYQGKSIYDEETEIRRSVLMVGADTPADVYLERDITLPTGEGLTPEGGRHQLAITHEEPTGDALSVWLRGAPVGFSERNFNPQDDSWAGANPTWFTLPVRSTPTRDRIPAPFATLHDITQTTGKDNFLIHARVGVRTSANQVNRVYDFGSEGGTILSGDELMFPRSRILSRTGPVVRDAAELFVANLLSTPVYYLKRGTGFCVIETLWDSAELPNATGIKRYVFGLINTGSDRDELYYDADNEEFVYNRQVAGITYSATKKHRAIAKGVPIRIVWRWISLDGDLGENPFSIQIYINDVRGTDGAPVSSPTQPSSSNFYLGSLDGSDGQMLDGRMRRMRITQQVLSLDRIKKLR